MCVYDSQKDGGGILRQEVAEKILMCLHSKGITDADIGQDLCIILNDYEITARETALVVRNEDRNRFYLQKFIIAKTVKGCTDRTLEYYQKTIWKILEEINKTADEITPDDIRLYLALRQKRDGVSKTTAANELRCLGTFYDYLQREELITRDPVKKVDRIKKDRTKKEAFTELDVEKLRCECKNSWETAVIEVLLSTGCRVSELVNIKIADIEGDKVIVFGKGNKERTVYLNAKALIAIEKYLKDRKDMNEYLFPGGFFNSPQKNCREWYKYPERVDANRHCDKGTIEAKVRKLGKRAGVKNTHPHKFRRTCATFALRRGMPIEQVSKMLGHESIETTQIYLDLREEELHQAHKKYVG